MAIPSAATRPAVYGDPVYLDGGGPAPGSPANPAAPPVEQATPSNPGYKGPVLIPQEVKPGIDTGAGATPQLTPDVPGTPGVSGGPVIVPAAKKINIAGIQIDAWVLVVAGVVGLLIYLGNRK